MGEATFEVSAAGRLVCDYPGCQRLQRYAIRLIGSTTFPRFVCGYHKRWAKARLVASESPPAVETPGAGEGSDGLG